MAIFQQSSVSHDYSGMLFGA